VDVLKCSEPCRLFPFIRSLVVAQLAQRREPWTVKQAARAWSPADALDEGGIGLDSFDLLTVAGQVNTMFHLHELGIEEYLLARRTPHEWAELILHAWGQLETPRVTFRTSGTTSTPKAVTHELALLDEEVSAFLDLLPPAGRTLAYVPAHHIYGFLFTVLMPMRDGSQVVPAYLNPIGERPREGDRIVAFPEMWKLLQGQSFPTGVHGISSTAPLAEDVAHQVRSKGVHLVEVYGSTETAGVGYRSKTATPYSLLPYWSRTDGNEVDSSSTIMLTRSGLAAPVAPPDHLEWHGERVFLPAGRVDSMVQVGGHNVSPTAIARRIETLASVKECAVRPMMPHEGERLKAFVVPAAEPHEPILLRQEVEQWAATHLPAHERPAHVLVGDQLPRDGLGKLVDWPLPARTV
jgi:long-chain acyl-CoA synthetase